MIKLERKFKKRYYKIMYTQTHYVTDQKKRETMEIFFRFFIEFNIVVL